MCIPHLQNIIFGALLLALSTRLAPCLVDFTSLDLMQLRGCRLAPGSQCLWRQVQGTVTYKGATVICLFEVCSHGGKELQ